jgi:Putative zinc-finger
MGFDSIIFRSHERAAQLIPWLVNGTLEPDASEWLRAHLTGCERCQLDFEEQRQVYEAMHAEGPLLFAADPSFRKLLPRLRPERPEPLGARAGRIARRRPGKPARRTPSSRRSAALLRWVAAAALIEALALGTGAYFWASARHPPAPTYFTLTSPAPSFHGGEQAHVVFKRDLSLGELQLLLHSVGAHIIDGPTDAGVYTLGFPPQIDAGTARMRIVALRAKAAVLFAEPSPGDPTR